MKYFNLKFVLVILFFNSTLFSETIELKNSGTLKGRNSTIYKINVPSNIKLEVSLSSKNRFVFFNINETNKPFDSLYLGHMASNPDFFESSNLKKSEYEISVYFMRNEARREHTATYDLNIKLTPIKKMHPSWDKNKDGINDCEEEGICDHTIDYTKPRI
jgi:hypothetical protein